jgi:hypothetical protein
MTLTLEEFNGMEFLWAQLPKKPDDYHVLLSLADIDAMWHCGLIDAKKFSGEDWRKAFRAYAQSDGTFLLDKNDFLKLDSYRYKGEIMMPFDAALINEGKYTDEGLKELFDMSIVPSCSLSDEEMKSFLNDFKQEFRDPASKLITVDIRGKMMIRDLLNHYPSPLRRLEIMFDYVINGEDVPEDALPIPEKFSWSETKNHPELLAKAQASAFTMRPTTDAEIKHKALIKIEKSRKKSAGAGEQGKSSVTLKKVKRSRKGLRG